VDALLLALAPALVAGMAVQRFLELADSLGLKRLGAQTKSMVTTVVSIGIGVVLAIVFKLRVLDALGTHQNRALDAIVTGLVISTGTEGVNSVVKFLGYKKEEQKAESNQIVKAAGGQPVDGAVG
jgi:hypothetical protein